MVPLLTHQFSVLVAQDFCEVECDQVGPATFMIGTSVVMQQDSTVQNRHLVRIDKFSVISDTFVLIHFTT